MSGHGTVVVAGPLPPPVTGAAVVTAAMRSALDATAARTVILDSNDNAPSIVRVLRLVRDVTRLAVLVAGGRRPALYVGGAGGELLWHQALLVALARLGGGPVVFHHHNTGPLTVRSPALRAVVRAGGSRALHVLLGPRMESELALLPRADRLRRTICSNAGQMLPAAPPPACHRCRASARPPGRLVLGHLSNLSTAKGLPTVVQTLTAARAAGLDVELRLAGPPGDADAEALVRAAIREHGDRIRWVGALASSEVPAFLDDLDLFLFPSRYRLEAEPLVLLEAARAGVPVVAFPVGDVASLVDPPGRVVELGAPYVPAALEVARSLIACGPEAHEQQRERLRAGFERRRTAAHSAWEAVLAELVEGSGAR